MKKTLTGPRGIKLILDSGEIYPDDPGNGTPAMVEYNKHFGSYSCVSETYDCDGITIPDECYDWLNSEPIVNEVENLYDGHRMDYPDQYKR